MRLRVTSLLVLLCGCGVPIPGGTTIHIAGSARLEVAAQVRVEAAPLDGSAAVEFFGVPLEGAQDVVFVLDRSGSMSQPALGAIAHIKDAAPGQIRSKIDVAHEELDDALGRLPEGTRLNVIFFNDALEAYSPALVALEGNGRAELSDFAKRAPPYGSTALGPALRVAFLMNARQVVLLSDGLGNVGGTTADILRDAREAMRGGVRIDTVGLGADHDRALMSTLAAESGGVYQAL